MAWVGWGYWPQVVCEWADQENERLGQRLRMNMHDSQLDTPSSIAASQWRQIVNSAADTAIISIDRRGQVTSWNAGATRILGWSEEEMLGQTLGCIFPPESEQLEREIADAIAHGRCGGEEGWRLRKDGIRL